MNVIRFKLVMMFGQAVILGLITLTWGNEAIANLAIFQLVCISGRLGVTFSEVVEFKTIRQNSDYKTFFSIVIKTVLCSLSLFILLDVSVSIYVIFVGILGSTMFTYSYRSHLAGIKLGSVTLAIYPILVSIAFLLLYTFGIFNADYVIGSDIIYFSALLFLLFVVERSMFRYTMIEFFYQYILLTFPTELIKSGYVSPAGYALFILKFAEGSSQLLTFVITKDFTKTNPKLLTMNVGLLAVCIIFLITLQINENLLVFGSVIIMLLGSVLLVQNGRLFVNLTSFLGLFYVLHSNRIAAVVLVISCYAIALLGIFYKKWRSNG